MSKKTQDWIFLIDGSYLLRAWSKIAPNSRLKFDALKSAIKAHYGLEQDPVRFFYFDAEETHFQFKPKNIDAYFDQVKNSGCTIIEGVKPSNVLDDGKISFSNDIIGAMGSLGNNIDKHQFVVVADESWLVKPFIQYLRTGARIYSAFFYSANKEWANNWFTLLLDGGFYLYNLDKVKNQIFSRNLQPKERIAGLNTPKSQINPVFADMVHRKPVNRQALLQVITSAHS